MRRLTSAESMVGEAGECEVVTSKQFKYEDSFLTCTLLVSVGKRAFIYDIDGFIHWYNILGDQFDKTLNMESL